MQSLIRLSFRCLAAYLDLELRRRHLGWMDRWLQLDQKFSLLTQAMTRLGAVHLPSSIEERVNEGEPTVQHSRSVKVLTMVISACALLSCGKSESDAVPIADPRAYAIESIQTMDLHAWWQAYRDPDPQKIGAIVDAIAEREKDGLPTQKSKLDLLIRHRIAGRYRLSMDDTDAGKAYILAQAEARFANPPSTVWDPKGNYALLDYHSLPGTWRTKSRVSEGLMDPPAIGSNLYLTPAVMAQSLQRLVAAHPKARTYQLRYQFHHGSELKKVLMQIVPDQQIVYRGQGELRFTKHRVPWQELIDGKIDLSELDWDGPMEGYPAPPLALPPADPLPLGPQPN